MKFVLTGGLDTEPSCSVSGKSIDIVVNNAFSADLLDLGSSRRHWIVFLAAGWSAPDIATAEILLNTYRTAAEEVGLAFYFFNDPASVPEWLDGKTDDSVYSRALPTAFLFENSERKKVIEGVLGEDRIIKMLDEFDIVRSNH